MSESVVANKSALTPKTIYRKDYQAPAYFIDEIDLDFDLYDEHALVNSHMRVRHNRHCATTSRDLILNGDDLILESLKLNGEKLTPSRYELNAHALIIHDAPDNFELDITTKIFPQKNTALSGLYRSAKTFCTQCEAEGFRRITFYPDHPDILARFTTTIRADAKQYPYLLSNGNLVDSGQLDGGRHWAKWLDPFNKPSYLFALVAGDFDVIEDTFKTMSEQQVKLQVFVEKGLADQAHHAMYSLKESMRWDEQAFGREYDLDIYMIVAIGDFNMGAMENKGLNIFNTKYVLAKPETATDDDYIHILSVIGHEYFHNWSGNRVTCRDWFQLSLKEGLTIFRDQSFTGDLLSRPVMRIRDVMDLRETQFPEDAGPLAHPVLPDSYIEINNFYTATIYNKGAEVLRMMQTILGSTLFRKGMDLYFQSFDGQAVTIEDFVHTMEDVSGIDLKQFRLWYSQAGTPIVTVKSYYDAAKKIYTLTMTQHCPATPGQEQKLPMHIPVRMALLDEKGHPMPLYVDDQPADEEKVLHLTNVSQTFTFRHVATRPVPSLLRHFSAPVKLHFDCSDEDLIFLFKHDTDAFNRWESGQIYLMRVIMRLIESYRKDKSLVLPSEIIEMYEHVLTHYQDDKFLLSEMLTIPSEKYIGEQMQVVDVDTIHEVREFVLSEIANELQSLLHEIYLENHDTSGTYRFGMQEIGARQLKNRCLSLLMMLPQYTDIGARQFDMSLGKNMTDTQAALVALVNSSAAVRESALARFYEHFKHDALVVDKWLAIQATSKQGDVLANVRALMQMSAFDIKNPNKVYALIGGFGNRNPVHFHAQNGSGYRFLGEVVGQLDKINPSVSARMVKPLTTWKRYDKERQVLMREQLDLLLQDKKISTDLYELVSKSL